GPAGLLAQPGRIEHEFAVDQKRGTRRVGTGPGSYAELARYGAGAFIDRQAPEPRCVAADEHKLRLCRIQTLFLRRPHYPGRGVPGSRKTALASSRKLVHPPRS